MAIPSNQLFSFRRRGADVPCPHTEMVQDVAPSAEGCEDCLALGDRWVPLRMCMTCGKVGCCDSSKNRHASAHAAQGHPIARSIEPGESWMWCYEDEIMVGSVEEGR